MIEPRRPRAAGLCACLLALVAAGCVKDQYLLHHPEAPELWLANWKGPLPPIALSVVGPESSDGTKSYCIDVFKEYKVDVNDQAPISTILVLAPDANHLRIVTAQKGTVVDEQRPLWYLADLCKDALAQSLRVAAQTSEQNSHLIRPMPGNDGAPGRAPSHLPAAAAGGEAPAAKSAWAPRDGAVNRPDALALIIGIESYQHQLPKADGAAHDAAVFGEFARRTLGLAADNVHVLVDAQATRSSIEVELDEWLRRSSRPGREIFFYFAGHGSPDPATGERYLVPWDADPKFIAQQGLAFDKVLRQISSLPASHVYAFLDACFSGTGRSVVAAGTRPLVVERHVDRGLSRRRALVVFSATGLNETAGSNDAGNGLFSSYLFRGLNGAADHDQDGTITLQELADYTVTEVTTQARKRNRDQHPQLVADDRAAELVMTRLPPRR